MANILRVQKQIRQVINVSGSMSILGVSTMADEVIQSMEVGAKHFYVMEELHDVAGKIAADFLQTEAAYLTNSASAGIALAVAGLITKERHELVQQLYDPQVFTQREIILMKGHHVDYGAPVGTIIQVGGGIVKEAGYANGCTVNHLAAAVTERTAGILFVQSHHCIQKNMPSLEEVSNFAHKAGLPLLVDIAAEEEMTAYSEVADVVILSGSKALAGPTSGIIAGKNKWMDAIVSHSSGIGRTMKIGKEAIFGLLEALQQYRGNSLSKGEQLQRLQPLHKLGELPGLTVKLHQDEAGREIYRARLQMDAEKAGLHAMELVTALKGGNPAIYTRDYNANLGLIDLDPRSVTAEEVGMVADRIAQLVEKKGERGDSS